MAKPLRIGIAGLGTVGAGVVRLLRDNADLIAQRAGRALTVTAVCARDRTRERGIDLGGMAWESDPRALAARADVDVVAELVGGADGDALTLTHAALEAGRGVVTANKAMVAQHGLALARLAEGRGAPFRFEAAVAGGIPVVKALREGTAANRIERVYGVLNGTSNYILSAMEASGADFTGTLRAAQELGYAEADPAMDIDGTDAAHKLAILAAIAFGARPDFAAVRIAGIAAVGAADIAQAGALGFAVRLIGMADAEPGPDGTVRLLQRVRPCLLAKDHPLAAVTGATNAVVAEGDFSGRLLFQGAGAGAGPTASAVVADLIDIAREDGDRAAHPFGVPVDRLRVLEPADPGHRTGRSYLRFTVADRPGVLAELTAAMRDAGVSIESLIQPGRADDGGAVPVAMVTHEGPERCVAQALALLEGSASLAEPPLEMPIIAR